MSECCNSSFGSLPPSHERRFRRTLWVALTANFGMFFVEAGASWKAESTALMADAIDFLGDAANYGVSLLALAAGTLWRSRVALAKGWVMGVYGIAVLLVAGWNVLRGASPEPGTMALVALLALLVNVGVAVLLYAFRNGDANMRSVWLCSRNDAIGNTTVMLAAAGVFGTGTIWPDVGVAVLLAGLGLLAARHIVGQARKELAAQRAVTRDNAKRAIPMIDK
ncbi:MAG: cation transporter [Betaproteobacteria bacterium]|jgi:Co/Zn/Cd efflux system component|nr:MAG: cation transporter [Betaproteobacteria bacterium]